MIPREQLHELPHLPGVLRFLVPADSFLWDVANVTKGGGVGLFSDIKPFLYQSPREVFCHRVSGTLRRRSEISLGPLLPKTTGNERDRNAAKIHQKLHRDE
jgi:hypothetical protein